MGKNRKRLPFACGVVVLFLAIAAVFMGSTVKGVQNVPVAMPNLSDVADGVYTGEYAAGPVAVEAEVSVQNHAITEILLLRHDNGLGRPAEQIIQDILEQQSLDVDAVSGATVSSRCILKAVENALEKGAFS